MITLITGIPGSGKSYMAVEHVSKLKDQSKILHNIEGFSLGIPLDKYSIDNKINKLDVFRKSYHEKSDSFHGWVFIIDEAAELFPRQLRDTDIISFFDYHRHYGIDVFLITQDIKKVSPDITCLAETHYRAASGAANPVPGYLLYQQIVGGESVSRKWLRKKKSIFSLYKSTNNHSSKTINIGKIYLAVSLVVLFLAIIGLKKWFSTFNPTKEQNTEVTQNKSINPPKQVEVTSRSKNVSVVTTLGGNPYPVSTIKDSTGNYILYCGVFYKKDKFPYPLTRSRTGLVALLPDQAYTYALQYEQKLDSKSNTLPKPNEPAPPASESDREAGASASGAGFAAKI